ncbi:hypothetical protein G7046_g7141 [Stylonectria norvegica]|nr:hypothetical protein G7046_g7141 [Stylonectria norvegica]
MPENSHHRLGHDVLCVFDTWPDTVDFLADIIESCQHSPEVQRLFDQSLMAGAEDWNYLIDCARSIRRTRGKDLHSLDGQDVLAYVWGIFSGAHETQSSEPWEQTDRLIAQAKDLERNLAIPPSLAVPAAQDNSRTANPEAKSVGRVTTSHFWSDNPQIQRAKETFKWSFEAQACNPSPPTVFQCENQILGNSTCSTLLESWGPTQSQNLDLSQLRQPHRQDDEHLASSNSWGIYDRAAVGAKQATVSPFFTVTPPTKKTSPKKRPPPGTVSTVPFAPLTSPIFGIIQEEFAHDPFWLLVAVTFLIKTNGNLAIPMFYQVKERYPTPQDVADPANAADIVNMIRHLGLSKVRVAFLQKYARGFLEDPPKAGIRYKVKNYDRRDFDPSLNTLSASGENLRSPAPGIPTPDENDGDLEAWEIGHMTRGKYSIDSWRIFCRDELLGRAEDWNGKSREPEFQPEWMRVMPDDKELRAFLRWMWMREGWEWDPATGERTVLRDEMQRAVNEGRVEYDDTGGLRILEAPTTGGID